MTMYGLLTFPSSEVDLVSVAEVVAPCVTDPKKRIRHAALECLAVLGQCLTGNHHSNNTLRDVLCQMNVGAMFDTNKVRNPLF